MLEKVMLRQLHEYFHFALEYQFQCVNTLPEEFSNLDAYCVGKSSLVTTTINNKKNQRPSNILEEVLCKVMGTD